MFKSNDDTVRKSEQDELLAERHIEVKEMKSMAVGSSKVKNSSSNE